MSRASCRTSRASLRKRPLFRKSEDDDMVGQQTDSESLTAECSDRAPVSIKRKRKLPPAVTPASTYTNHNTTTTVDTGTDTLIKDGSCEQGTPETMAAGGSACLSELSLQSPGTSAVSEEKRPEVIDDDLLLGLCPEDLMNSSTSFCTSMNDTSIGRLKGETLPSEVKTPLIQSPNYPFTTNMHSAPVHSTPKPSIHKQSLTVNVPTDRLKCAAISESPTCTTKNQYSVPSNTFYGLPLKVKKCMEEFRGITTLYDWQDTCLRLPSVVNGGNLIYSLPTSGGKTLVAELIIFRQILLNDKDVLFILPFVSIVQEKVRDLMPFVDSLGFAVEEYAAGKGKIPPRNRRKKHVVYIATIEKANGLVNSLIEQGRLLSLGLVVVDELHMLGDGSVRGATLEACLAKVLHCSKSTQIIGMSATLSNIHEVAQFLRAEVYSDDFRPVELVQYAKVGRCVYLIHVEGKAVNMDPVRDISDMTDAGLDPDQLGALILEVVPQSSCLVFCPTKKNCQNVALLLAKCLQRVHRVKKAECRNLLRLLDIETSGVCPVLAQTIPYGVAYHHSGLTADERRVIEDGYLEGALCVLACTSTLAAGVNLPAKRVILRSPYVGNQFLSQSQYKQMIGRAGRSGLCQRGESILMFKDCDKEKVIQLLSSPYERCESSLVSGGSAVLCSLVLTLIGLKLVKNSAQLYDFLMSTLAYIQTSHDYLEQRCRDILSWLVEMKYITMETGDNSTYLITPLGKATLKGCIPVDSAHLIHQDLLNSQRCLVLATDLHLLFLSTSADLSTSIQPNWMRYFENLTSLGADELKVAELVGVKPGILSKKATGLTVKMTPEISSVYHRFYLSLMLHYLLKANSPSAIWKVANLFQCSRGFLQSVVNSTASFASCLTYFTQELPELWALSLLFPVVSKKLAFTSNLELVPLMEVQGVKQGRARQLVSAGITTPQQLASTDPKSLCGMIDHLYTKQAKRMVEAAKALLADQAEALMEEAEELISLIPTSIP